MPASQRAPIQKRNVQKEGFRRMRSKGTSVWNLAADRGTRLHSVKQYSRKAKNQKRKRNQKGVVLPFAKRSQVPTQDVYTPKKGERENEGLIDLGERELRGEMKLGSREPKGAHRRCARQKTG